MCCRHPCLPAKGRVFRATDFIAELLRQPPDPPLRRSRRYGRYSAPRRSDGVSVLPRRPEERADQCASGHQPHQPEALRLFVDHCIRIPAFSTRVREALSQYIARPPLSLKKIGIEENGQSPQSGDCPATAVSFTSQSDFFKGKTETFPVIRFFPELTQRIPPQRLLIHSALRTWMLPAARGNGRTSPMWWGWLPRGGRRSDCRPTKTCGPRM